MSAGIKDWATLITNRIIKPLNSFDFDGDFSGVYDEIIPFVRKIDQQKSEIDELIFNLIDNAIKYNKDNGSVTVSLLKEGNVFQIVVADTGIGIAEEHRNRVFERFYRADKSRSKKTGGTGLGLSIVKHITEYHGGTVTLTSALDSGTTVECKFGGSLLTPDMKRDVDVR